MGALSAISVIVIIAGLSILFKLAERIEEENRMFESGLETLQIYNRSLHSKIDEIRRFRHDAAGLLQAIEMYGLGDGIAQDRTGGHVYSGKNPEKSEMPLLEAIVELKRRQSLRNGIAFDCPPHFPEMPEGLILPDETDLCLLVQNLLDNAYEANLRIADSSSRLMRLEVGTEKFSVPEGSGTLWKLIFIVINRVDDGEKITYLTRKSRPELHGIGLRIVDDILEKYNGRRTVSLDPSERLLTTSIVLEVS